MKLYTRHGDDGTTGLFGGDRIDKPALRIEAFGTIDETNSAIGSALVVCPFAELTGPLSRIQSELFDLGAVLSLPHGQTSPHIKPMTGVHVTRLEHEIDALEAQLQPMRHFILPGGSELAARLHLARCIARRAERIIVALHRHEPLDAMLLAYINRLSDLLFAMARRANQLHNIPDVPWKPSQND
jgi:cob(I)alamin adenosyltransferase